VARNTARSDQTGVHDGLGQFGYLRPSRTGSRQFGDPITLLGQRHS
jgi:hypothetical protein